MLKTCQFSDADLAAKLSLAAELPALSILAFSNSRGTTSGEGVIRGAVVQLGMKLGGKRESVVGRFIGMHAPRCTSLHGVTNERGDARFWLGSQPIIRGDSAV